MTITKEMSIGEIVQSYPQTVRVFLSHGLMCIGCAAARFENLEQGAMGSRHRRGRDPSRT
jgi:hybrid cluster-associated redox disulfide protein